LQDFWGIEPYSDLFHYLFHHKPQPSEKEISYVGGAGLQLQQGMKKVYIPYKLSSKVMDWKSRWFYIENHAPSLPERTPSPPKIHGEWSTSPLNKFQVNGLLNWLKDLRKEKLTGAAVVMSLMQQRIQPL